MMFAFKTEKPLFLDISIPQTISQENGCGSETATSPGDKVTLWCIPIPAVILTVVASVKRFEAQAPSTKEKPGI